ncbi:hypothetical protein [Azospira restricta]|uniref:Uncharacterized protein n=1 Tax=Azospira restricta TaxID=404405 RepID=A0A974PWS7_9RHOO|nr:hypothetical protein [Azospira restricta]QRJ62375.1 hypothetical protein IWH25_11285 [Azospira restricta]
MSGNELPDTNILQPTIEPLFNATDDKWVLMVGKYIINMGGVEAATRLLISIVDRSDNSPVMSGDLPSRLGYLRRRFPREPKERHSRAMAVFEIAAKHVGFRNIVAHSPIIITGHADGSRHVQGILNITPNDPFKAGELVGLDELHSRVDESAALSRDLLSMQEIFRNAVAT